MLADVLAWTGLVPIGKVALSDPAITVTLAGMETTDGFVLERPTMAPCGGAGEFMVTVPCSAEPPVMLGELMLTVDRPIEPPL